jgi:hypothetical protein
MKGKAFTLWPQIEDALASARNGAGPQTLGQLDAVKSEFRRTRDYEPSNPEAGLDLGPLRAAMSSEVERPQRRYARGRLFSVS